jgi:hypothetical protein
MSFELLIEILQYGSFIGPIVGGIRGLPDCVLLQNTDAHPIQRPVGGIMIRDARGGYHTLGHNGSEAHEGNGRPRQWPRRGNGPNGTRH